MSCPEVVDLNDIATKICAELHQLNFAGVEALIQLIPDGALLPALTGTMKNRPLHLAATCEAGPNIIQGLIDVLDVEAANRPDPRGHTPLHISCQLVYNPRVFEILVEAWPDAIVEESRDFCTPLDDLISRVGEDDEALHWDIVRSLKFALEYCPRAIDHVNHKGQTLLHRTLKNGGSEAFIQSVPQFLIQRKPALAHLVDRDLTTPLHEACKRDDSLSIVQALVAVSTPAQLMARDNHGRSVLHYAIHWAAPVEVVEELLMSCYDLIHTKDSDGRTPLDYFASFYRLDNYRQSFDTVEDNRVIRCLFNKGPYKDITHSGKLLVHSALYTERCPMCIIGYLACIQPDQVNQLDQSGYLPLQLAARLESLDVESSSDYLALIQTLLEQFPQAAKANDPRGLLPLQSMIRAGRKWNTGIMQIIAAHPAAICDLNLDSYCLSTILARLDANSIFRLLQDAPILI